MEPLKNLINLKTAKDIYIVLGRYQIAIDEKKFLKNLEAELLKRELKERIALLSLRLHEGFCEKNYTYTKIAKALTKAFKDEQNNSNKLISGFSAWPFLEYVSQYGINFRKESLSVLKEATVVFTGEFAIRPFLAAYEKELLDILENFSRDKNEHVRRLATEGSRPLLPWGMKLNSFVKDPKKTLAILENLKFDKSLYVRKSVANHLNDHSKNHPDFVIKVLKRWKQEAIHLSGEVKKNLEWVTKHALRTLIKKNNTKAFELIGVKSKGLKIVESNILTSKVTLGERLMVEVKIKNSSLKEMKMIVDHDVYLLKKNNTYNVKCFKGSSLHLQPSEVRKIKMKIHLKPVTTRTYYPGKHYWTVKVNGLSGEKKAFNLKV